MFWCFAHHFPIAKCSQSFADGSEMMKIERIFSERRSEVFFSNVFTCCDALAHTWLLHRTYFVKAYGLKNRENKLNPNSLQASGRSSPSCRTPAVGCDADSERPKRRAGNGFPRNKMEMKSNRFSLSTLTG